MGKIGTASPCLALESDRVKNIVDTLFPTYPARIRKYDAETLNNIPLFSEDGLSRAVDSLQSRKVAESVGMLVGVFKAVVHQQLLLNMQNRCLSDVVFHRRWKVQRLVLIISVKSHRPMDEQTTFHHKRDGLILRLLLFIQCLEEFCNNYG